MANFLKYYDYAIVFKEFPDYIALAVNITNCPCNCEGCSEPYLRENIGTELTNDEIDKLVKKHSDCNLFGLMGGDSNHNDVVRIANYIHTHYPYLKVGMYSGLDSLDTKLLECLDFYKIGRFIMPKGEQKTNNGPICFPWSNQIAFEKINNKWINITYKFRKETISDLNKYVILTKKEKTDKI